MDAPDQNSVVCKGPSTSKLLVLQQSTAPSSAGLASTSAGTIRNSTLQTSVQVLAIFSQTSVQLLASSSMPSHLYQREREAVEHFQKAGDWYQASKTGGVLPEEAAPGSKNTMTLAAVQVDFPIRNREPLRDPPMRAAANADHKKNKVHVPLQAILHRSNRDSHSDAGTDATIPRIKQYLQQELFPARRDTNTVTAPKVTTAEGQAVEGPEVQVPNIAGAKVRVGLSKKHWVEPLLKRKDGR